MWTGILGLYFIWQTAYSPVYMKVNYLFNLCLFKVSQLFCKHAIPKICVSSIFSSVKKRNMLCSGETFEIERKLYHPSLLLIWVPVWHSSHQVYTCVSNVNFALCGGWGGGSRNIFCMPRCRFIVLNMHA